MKKSLPHGCSINLANGNTRTVALLGTSTMGPATELPGKSFLLKNKGRLYLSNVHPCYNQPERWKQTFKTLNFFSSSSKVGKQVYRLGCVTVYTTILELER